jgi:hypothetical protein
MDIINQHINSNAYLHEFINCHSRESGNPDPFCHPRESGDPGVETGFPRIKSGAGLVKPGMTIILCWMGKGK